MADKALANISKRFDARYATTGWPSIPPEKLRRAPRFQMWYWVRRQRLLREEIDYRLLYRWFVGMNLDEPVWDATVFTKNRDRLLDGDGAREFLSKAVRPCFPKSSTMHQRPSRHALTVAFVKPGHGSCPYQAMNSASPRL